MHGVGGPIPITPSPPSPWEPEQVPGQGCLLAALCSQRVLVGGSQTPLPKPCQPAAFAAWPAPSKAVTAQIRPPRSPVAPGRLTASCSQPRCAAYLSPLLPRDIFSSLSFPSQPVGLLSQAPNHPFPRHAQQHPLQTHFQGLVHSIRGASDNQARKSSCLKSLHHTDVPKPLPAAKA